MSKGPWTKPRLCNHCGNSFPRSPQHWSKKGLHDGRCRGCAAARLLESQLNNTKKPRHESSRWLSQKLTSLRTRAVKKGQRQKALNLAKEEGKPDSVAERTVAGRLAKYMDEHCLLRQPYVRDDTLTFEKLLHQNIASLGGNVIIRRFVRWEVSEEIEA